MRMMRFVAILVCLAAISAPAAEGCTTFCLRDGVRVVFGKNYDWMIDDGLLFVNKRGVRRHSSTSGSPASWVSRYGSVTFNQFGRDFPSGGINETGLVIELMWLDGSIYPHPDERASVDNLEWIQYQLDTASLVEQVLASDTQVRIQAGQPLHYLVADSAGQVATVEFLNGRMVAHTGESLPVAALANDSFAASWTFLQQLDAAGQPVPEGPASLYRFARAANRVRSFSATGAAEPVDYAFATLAQVAQTSTQWSIVYEADRGQVHFQTRASPSIKTLALDDLDFECALPVLMIDLHVFTGGEISSRLESYDPAANLALVRSSFGSVPFLADTPAAVLADIAAHPDSSVCLARRWDWRRAGGRQPPAN